MIIPLITVLFVQHLIGLLKFTIVLMFLLIPLFAFIRMLSFKKV